MSDPSRREPGPEAPHADPLTTTLAGEASPVSPGGTEPTLPAEWGASPGRPERPPRPMPRVPGYEVIREVGRGGMGVVYSARNVRLNRPCALKMILAGAHASPESAVRFLVEAEASARLRHPNIVQVYHVGEVDGLPYVEMELVVGGGLETKLDGTPWPPDRAADLVEALARGVGEAHAVGVVHRDLKPANILLDADGTPKVADFGLAKFLATDRGLTRTESILGSPSYMAPEQAGGGAAVGPPADVNALGSILYELLTGRPPFKAPTVLETLEQVKSVDPVHPSRLVPRVPRDLETIALVCLRKEPHRRYASASALAEDLRRFRAGEPIQARRIGPIRRGWRWCRRNPAVAGLTTATMLLLTALAAGSTVAAIRLNEQRNAVLDEQALTLAAEERRREGLVDALMVAAPDGVPILVDAIRPSRERVVPRLRARLAESAAGSARRLRAAEGLGLLGVPEVAALVEEIATAQAGECRNIVDALAPARSEALGSPAAPGWRSTRRSGRDTPRCSSAWASPAPHARRWRCGPTRRSGWRSSTASAPGTATSRACPSCSCGSTTRRSGAGWRWPSGCSTRRRWPRASAVASARRWPGSIATTPTAPSTRPPAGPSGDGRPTSRRRRSG